MADPTEKRELRSNVRTGLTGPLGAVPFAPAESIEETTGVDVADIPATETLFTAGDPQPEVASNSYELPQLEALITLLGAAITHSDREAIATKFQDAQQWLLAFRTSADTRAEDQHRFTNQARQFLLLGGIANDRLQQPDAERRLSWKNSDHRAVFMRIRYLAEKVIVKAQEVLYDDPQHLLEVIQDAVFYFQDSKPVQRGALNYAALDVYRDVVASANFSATKTDLVNDGFIGAYGKFSGVAYDAAILSWIKNGHSGDGDVPLDILLPGLSRITQLMRRAKRKDVSADVFHMLYGLRASLVAHEPHETQRLQALAWIRKISKIEGLSVEVKELLLGVAAEILVTPFDGRYQQGLAEVLGAFPVDSDPRVRATQTAARLVRMAHALLRVPRRASLMQPEIQVREKIAGRIFDTAKVLTDEHLRDYYERVYNILVAFNEEVSHSGDYLPGTFSGYVKTTANNAVFSELKRLLPL